MNDISVNNGVIQIDANTGDFKTRESNDQEIEHILKANKGVFRQSPIVGVGMFKFLNGSFSSEFIKKEIKLALNYDNFVVDDLNFLGGEIEVNATRK